MKTPKILLLLILIGSSLQLASQVTPVSIDLRSNGVKLQQSDAMTTLRRKLFI